MATSNFEPKAGNKETPRVVPLMSMDVDGDQLDKSAAFVLNPAAQPLDLIHWCAYEAARLQECAEAGIAAKDHYAEDALQTVAARLEVLRGVLAHLRDTKLIHEPATVMQ